jgi:aspartyl-tRNA(Asn)/glutamyl-tRNA(Gln) amidotransferase subunit A
MASAALGSDTGGSVRQPAAFCGVVGLKPTYGRVSRFGLIAFASSLDQIGPLARTVPECAAVLHGMAGADERDMTCAREPVPDYEALLEGDLRGLRIGIPREYLEAELPQGISGRVREALEHARELGAEVVDVSLGMSRYAIAAYYLIANAEASSNLARYDGVRYGRRVFGEDVETTYRRTRSEGFGPEARRRILLGTYALSAGYYDAYYGRALQVRRRIRDEMAAILREVDLIVGPTCPETAFPLGAKVADPLSMYLSDIFTVPASLGGYPALSLPCGLEDGLPVGLQLVGRRFEEALLLRAAAALERALGFRLAPRVMA